jgi:iron complex outermembrane receptor protein
MSAKLPGRRLQLFATAAILLAATHAARAGGASTTQVNLGLGQASEPTTSETVIVKEQRRLLKEKNSPSAVTELGTAQIAANGVAGSAATLLRQAPSVFVYQQSLGDNAPELTVRGLRGLEIASTLDGVPTQDLLAPGSFYLSNNIGGIFTTNQISSVSIYPGVAYPDKNTFGTIGGTIAYDSKRPAPDRYLDVIGSVGSFGTDTWGFEANSGAIDSILGTGDNAIRALLNYKNFQTNGFIDGLSNRENEMEFALDKPYDDGLSKAQVTVIYNTGQGFIQDEPVPIPYLEKNGMFSNYPENLEFSHENNDWLDVILKNDKYINDYLTVGGTLFYLSNDNNQETYGAPQVYTPNGVPGPLSVGNSIPFINNPAGFGEEGLYGPPVGGQAAGYGNTPFGIYSLFGYPLNFQNAGYGGYFYGSGNRYNPAKYYNPKDCPANVVNLWGSYGFSPCGLNDQVIGAHSDTYGFQPRATIIAPEYYGIANTIKVGGLFAKETSPTGYTYLGGTPNTPQDAANAAYSPTGGVQRTIYQGYIQDKIDLLENTLHITPGGTVEGTQSSLSSAAVRYATDLNGASTNAPAYGPGGAFGPNGALTAGGPGTNLDKYGPFKSEKWDREYLPFVNVSYDFDKILPMAKGLSVYGSFGDSALFAPVTDFGPNSAGPPPYASIVHLYEGGVKYNTSNLVLSADYFYQKVDRDFGFFSYQSGPLNGLSEYSDYGQREFKGVEAAATWQVTPQIQLFGNVSHLLAKYLTSGFAFDTVAEDQYGIELKGNPVSGIPDWLSTFGADYQRKSTFMDSDNINVRVTGQYTGHQFTTYDYGGNDYLNKGIQFAGLEPLNFSGCPGSSGNGSCLAYTRYNQITGATVTNTNGGGISPFAIFNLDASYTLPTPYLPALKKITFDVNIQNLFDERFFQYYYAQIPPGSCGTFTSGPFKGLPKNNYSCNAQFQDAIPGQPFGVYFTVTARF